MRFQIFIHRNIVAREKPDETQQAGGGRRMKTRVYVTDDHALVRRGLASLIAAESDMELCGEAADCATATSEVAKLRPDVAPCLYGRHEG